VIAISGYLIKWTGSYVVAFWFGCVLSSIAVIVFFIYRHIMRSDGTSTPASSAAAGGAAFLGDSVSAV
jgi:hypothetical protein